MNGQTNTTREKRTALKTKKGRKRSNKHKKGKADDIETIKREETVKQT